MRQPNNLRAALQQVLVNRNPNTQAAIMMIAVDLALEVHDTSAALRKACSVWDAVVGEECAKRKLRLSWEFEEKYAAEFIRGLRRCNAGWRAILERGTQ